MKSEVIAVFTLIFLSVSVAVAADIEGSEAFVYEPLEGNAIQYRVYTPVNSHGSRPLVVFLHGWGEKGTDNLSQLTFAQGLIDASRVYQSYLLAPQLTVEDAWGGDTVSPLVEIIDLVVANNPNIDTDRIYLTGYSNGGFGTFYAMLRFPNFFAATIPMSSSISPTLGWRIAHIPTWGVNGEFDNSADRMEELISEMADLGGDARYMEIPDLGHGGWDEIYRDNDALLYPWLFGYSLKALPVGDINASGALDVADLLLLQRAITGQILLDPSEIVRGDIDSSGSLDIADLILLERAITS